MKKALLPVSAILLCLLFTGCFNVDRNFKTIRNITLKECGRNFTTEHEFALGGFELWAAGGIAGLFVDDEMASTAISAVSEIQVGIYRRTDVDELPARGLLKKIDEEMEGKGWKYIVRSHQGGELSVVYINKDSDKMLNKLFVINIDKREMNIVRVSGDLEKVIEAAIKEGGLNWDKDKHRRLADR